jgi:stage II sporulation protein D
MRRPYGTHGAANPQPRHARDEHGIIRPVLVVRSRHATVLVLLLVSAGCGVSRRPGSPPSSAGGALGAPLRVNVGSLRHPDIVTIDLEDYVRETVPAEIVVPPADDEFAEGVYQAQAIVARTYAVASRGRHAADGFDLCSTTHCQVFRRATGGADVPQDVADAVAATTSRVLAYDGRPIRAVFHAHCGGHTSDADVIWPGAPVAYLRGVPDPFCQRERDARWSFRISARDLTSALDRLPATRVDGRLDGLQIMERDPAGRVVLIALTGARSALIRGEDLRSAVIRAGGARSVRSPRYDISRRGDAFFFVGDGEGHGAGLCQSGMVGRIKAGHTPEEVLEYYYQGARVARLEQLSGT